ncbi:MAG: protease pro-enzyme activation domain-containing protein [Candidatus Sulfotelmatobacter sp.]
MTAISVSRPSSSFSAVHSVLIATIICVPMLCTPIFAQETAQPTTSVPRPLITQSVDESQLTTLKGNTHPLARPEFDLGTAQADLPMKRMLLVLKRSSDQETALRKLLDDQQDKHSPNYHKWLSPQQFGKQFGPTETDMQTLTAWLQSHGFEVGSTKGRTVLEFSGSASQVQEAFHTTIHKYIVNGEQHWANASDPMVPTALTPAVAGVLTLHNFIKKPALHFSGEAIPAKLIPGKKPQVTFPAQNGQPAINALAPQDYATIYNINPVYSNNNGSDITIAVVGRSNLFNGGADIYNFGNNFGRCCGAFNIILDGADPGDLGGGEEAEATLDSTWSSAIAPGATVNLVVSASTNTTDGIDLSEVYIVENNLADIMTESFSSCELYATDGQLAFSSSVAEQAAAQGITYFVSTGDDGAAGCDDPSVAPATNPISVNLIASTAFDVAVGGTEFNENEQVAKYWGAEPPVQESAISYIPENVWNESSLTNGLWAGSGGASAGNIQGGLGGTTPGVPKPAWQYGVIGIPDDGVRDLPDVSLTAAGHDPYLLCLEGSCVLNNQGQFYVYFISGTSASTPAFAGIMALVDQEQVLETGNMRQGLANYVLYRLAASDSAYPSQCNGSNASTPPVSTCVFNDVTVGNNVVPGEFGSQYQATAGYDQATGLGSVNVANLVNQWSSVTFNPTTTVFSLSPTTSIIHGSAVSVNVSVTPNGGTGSPIPTGNVALSAFTGLSSSGLTFAGSYALAQGAVVSSTSDLPGGGPYWVTAYYSGDATYAASTSLAVSVTVNPEPSTITENLLAFGQTGNSLPLSDVPFGSFIYLRADVQGASGQGFPTGTVTFADTFGAIPGGSSFPLNSRGNTANPNGVAFDTGTHTISASYSGDSSFNASSTTQSQSLTITPGFFATIPTNASEVLISAPGATGISAITVSNSTGFNGTINLACAGLPYEATCTFSPATIKATGTFSTTTATITVTTTAATAMLRSQRRQSLLAQWMLGTGLLLSIALGCGKQQRARAFFLLLTLMLIVAVPGCGGGGGGGGSKGPPPNTGTPTGVSNVVVTATSGSTVSQTSFTLSVQ